MRGFLWNKQKRNIFLFSIILFFIVLTESFVHRPKMVSWPVSTVDVGFSLPVYITPPRVPTMAQNLSPTTVNFRIQTDRFFYFVMISSLHRIVSIPNKSVFKRSNYVGTKYVCGILFLNLSQAFRALRECT